MTTQQARKITESMARARYSLGYQARLATFLATRTAERVRQDAGTPPQQELRHG